MSRISFLDASLPEDTAVIVDCSKLIADGVAQLLSERRTLEDLRIRLAVLITVLEVLPVQTGCVEVAASIAAAAYSSRRSA